MQSYHESVLVCDERGNNHNQNGHFSRYNGDISFTPLLGNTCEIQVKNRNLVLQLYQQQQKGCLIYPASCYTNIYALFNYLPMKQSSE